MLSRNNHAKQPHFINVFGFPNWVKCWLDKILKCSKVWNNKLKRLHQTHQSSHVAVTRKDVTNKLRRSCCSLQLKKSWEFRKMTKMRSFKKLPGRSHLSCRKCDYQRLQGFKGSKIHTDSQWHVAQAKSVLGMATVMLGLFFLFKGNRLKNSACCCFQFLCAKKHPPKKWEVVFVKRYERGKRRGGNNEWKQSKDVKLIFWDLLRCWRCWPLDSTQFAEVLGKT